MPMVLKLEFINILNFKSFKGLHTISALDDHFTAIVGPNGSGKSNIIDSILFVLGFKAKKMRHAMLKDLITTDCSECYVELTFNSFKLSRSLRGRIDGGTVKNVVSKYELNGSEVSAAESAEFLKANGIDLDNNRFLILQGEIETIAMMNPTELLEYIEDCIGTSNYKPRIETLENGIRTCQEELDSVANNLKFVETDYLFKKGRRDEKVELLVFRNESLVMKNRIVLVKQALAERKEANLLKAKSDVESKLSALTAKHEEASKDVKKLEAEASRLNLKCKENELVQYKNEYNRIERENRTKDQKKKRIEKHMDRILKDIEDNKQSIESWERESATLKNSYRDNCKEIEMFEGEIKMKSKELGQYDEIKHKNARKSLIEATLLQLIERKDCFNIEISGINALKEKVKSIQHSIEMIGTVKNAPSERKILENEISNIKHDISATLQEINRRKRRAEEFEHLEQGYKREWEVFENLKSIPGVFGVLKNLGAFEKKYEEAIEASTKLLNSIVVDKTSTAEECIDVINRKRLNRTTFIILDKLPEPRGETLPSSARAELLYKKVKTDERFIKCFYFAIKDTLCVESLEDARALAFGKVRRRVVTLDGKLLEKSGVMSGGKAAKRLKSFAELEQIYSNMQTLLEKRVNQLEEICSIENQKSLLSSFGKQVGELNKEISRKQSNINMEEYKNLEDDISKLRNEIKELENIKLPLKAAELKADIQLLNEKIDYLQKINQDIKIKLSSEPQNNISSLEREYAKLKKEYGSFEIELLPDINVLNNLEEEYNAALKKHSAIQDQINQMRAQMGCDYHQEAEYKAKVEEIAEAFRDVLKIKDNCMAKKQEIMNEYTMAKRLLLAVNPEKVPKLDDSVEFIDEMNDAELKQKSREMVEELNVKEAANFKKLKESIKPDRDFSVEEDLEIYRIIFSEYESAKKIYDELKTSCDSIGLKLDQMKVELENLNSERLTKFMEGFNSINRNIKEIFNLITFGGNAELDLLDYLNPFRDGIVLSIMPPKKSWKQISNLSGGEKTLSSLALIFSLHKYRPSSLYIMDEIDAALDFKNVSIISQYLSHVDAQFIVISLRNDMFEKARTLVGVYKTNDVSKAITVSLDSFVSAPIY